ncbi:hypothetical protein TSOC_000395 [Tetrabaena socialis]|uniref:Mitochondrial outer membrane transport complex Sam37/metaxin N-terminal domain-containing protein n=1 Tax=Tetrabaena socialis TaxID=47790 RepID=A0A2J8AJM1_9CHLO|nr:hypothetical protein TSOC_000395 [Tetrabaena socialis]|eukprot:PNH12717.1 hypothetical protein TSOC_000395 [Tetrabaena socialis]
MSNTGICVLYKWPECWGLPSLSPACIQAEAYLRLCGASFAVETCSTSSSSPTGQLPALEQDAFIVAPAGDDEFGSALATIGVKYGSPLAGGGLVLSQPVLCEYVDRLMAGHFAVPATPRAAADSGAGGSSWSDAAKGQRKAPPPKVAPTAAELQFRRNSYYWLLGAGAAVAGYILLSGRYIQPGVQRAFAFAQLPMIVSTPSPRSRHGLARVTAPARLLSGWAHASWVAGTGAAAAAGRAAIWFLDSATWAGDLSYKWLLEGMVRLNRGMDGAISATPPLVKGHLARAAVEASPEGPHLMDSLSDKSPAQVGSIFKGLSSVAAAAKLDPLAAGGAGGAQADIVDQVDKALHAAYDRPDVPLQPAAAGEGLAGSKEQQLAQGQQAQGQRGVGARAVDATPEALRSVDLLRDGLVDQVGGDPAREEAEALRALESHEGLAAVLRSSDAAYRTTRRLAVASLAAVFETMGNFVTDVARRYRVPLPKYSWFKGKAVQLAQDTAISSFARIAGTGAAGLVARAVGAAPPAPAPAKPGNGGAAKQQEGGGERGEGGVAEPRNGGGEGQPQRGGQSAGTGRAQG